MKYIVNLLALLFIPVFLFAGYTFAKSNSEPINTGPERWPFLLEEVLASGEVIIHSGDSAEIDLRKISIDLNVNPYSEDKLTSFPKIDYGMGGKITLHRAPTYTVVDGKKSTHYRSWAESVGELFSEKNIALGDEDKINFSVDENLTENMQIKIIRVARTNVHEFEDIDYDVIEKDDPELEYGKKRIETGGKGEKEYTYLVTREDGVEIERKLLSTEITKKPTPQITYVGTKVTVLSSVKGRATIGPSYCSIVSANYNKGALLRITNLANGVVIYGNVDCTWGAANAPYGVVLDLSMSMMKKLGWNGSGSGPNVLVEKIKQ